MKAGILFARNVLRYDDWPDPALKPGCVKVRVQACGICGSDVPRVLGEEAHFYPIILGHEFSGEIVETASDVTARRVGERVAGVPLLPCMHCEDCQRGHYSACKRYGFIGSRNQGAFAEYIVIPQANAIPIGPHVSHIQAALFEPAAVALHGLLKIGFQGGEDVAILGAGNIGILALQWARIFGARRIAVYDISPARLALAREMGADAVMNPQDEAFAEQAAAFTGGRGFPYVFETAGQPDTILLGFDIAASHGTFCCIGTPHRDLTFGWKQWEQMNRKQLWVTGSWMSYSAPFPGREWSLCAHYFGNGRLKLHESMIHDVMPLSRISEAFTLFETPGKVAGKLMIEMGGQA